MDLIKTTIDDVIYSLGKLNEILKTTDEHSLEIIYKEYPLSMKPEEMLQKLIDWRITLDSYE